MTNVTIAVPSDLKDKLDGHPEINWSEVARRAWKEKIVQLELLDELTSKSKATDADISDLAAIIKKGMTEMHDQRAKELKKG